MTNNQEYNLNDYIPPWLQQHLGELPSAEREQFLAQYDAGIQDLLKQLRELPLNQVKDGTESGEFSARIPGTTVFINLKSSLWTLAKYGGPLLLASSLAAPLVASLGITVAAPHVLSTMGSAVAALYQAAAKLNRSEMDTYLAVAATIERNKNQRFDPVGAKLPQILESFRRDQQNLTKPNDLDETLVKLVEKKVLTDKISENTGTKYYYLAF